jgi:hypothetical protein
MQGGARRRPGGTLAAAPTLERRPVCLRAGATPIAPPGRRWHPPASISTSLEELFEVWTWGLLGIHDKPVALLDPDGFWDPMVEQLDRIVASGYLSADRRERLPRFDSVAALLATYDDVGERRA